MIGLDTALQTLCDAEVEFVVIGGVAANFHGSGTVTFDLDICYSRSASNLGRLAQALNPFHPRPRGFPDDLPFVWDERTLRNGSLFTLTTDFGDIDLLGAVAGLGTYEEIKAKATMVEALGRRFAALDLRSLIQSKRAAGRKKDLEALPELEGLVETEEP